MGESKLARQVASLPATPGVYAFHDRRGKLLYVGKSVNLRRRVASYLDGEGGHTGYTRSLKRKAARVEFLETGSELEALVAEARAIRTHQPQFNVTGRHARHYWFVRGTSERVPRVQAVREMQRDGARYYGPFPPELGLESALAGLQAVLRWRRCDILERKPCLHFEVGHCTAPCMDRNLDQYGEMLRTLDGVLRGQGSAVLASLDRRMHDAAKALGFEAAARLRDRRQALAAVLDRSPFLTLDVAVVAPQRGWVRLLAVRAGRLIHAATLHSGRYQDLEAAAAAFAAEAACLPPPGPAYSELEQREIDVVTGYLTRIQVSGRIVELHAANPQEVGRRIMGALGRPGRAGRSR